MQLNGEIKNVRYISAFLTALLFFLGGGAFIGFGIYCLVNPEQEDKSISIYMFIAGGIAILISVFLLLRTIKQMRRKPLSEEEVKAHEALLKEEGPDIENLENIKLAFRYGGTLNQSYFVRNNLDEVVYECKLKRFNPFGKDLFIFNDVKHNYTKEYKMGKVTTSSTNDIALSSGFSINGVNCWEYLRYRGYEVKWHALEGRNRLERIELVKLGKTVANVVLCNIKDPFNEDDKSLLFMPKGSYRLEIIDAKLKDVVMAAFIFARVDIVE